MDGSPQSAYDWIVRVGRDRDTRRSPQLHSAVFGFTVFCLASALLARGPAARRFRHARQTPGLTGPRLSGRRIPCSMADAGSIRGRAVQSSVAISACCLPGCGREIELRFRFSASDQTPQSGHGHGLVRSSSEEEPHIVGTRESGYSRLCIVYRTRIGSSCGIHGTCAYEGA